MSDPWSESNSKWKKEVGIYTTLLIILSLLLIPLFMLWMIQPEKWYSFNLSDYNELGDAIGGLSAPIIGVGAAILVFMTFQVQVQANKMQYKELQRQRRIDTEQREFQLIYRQYEELKMDFKQNFVHEESPYSSRSALHDLSKVINSKLNGIPFPSTQKTKNATRIRILKNLDGVNIQFSFLFRRLIRNQKLTDEDLLFLSDKILVIYNQNFYPVYELVKDSDAGVDEGKILLSDIHEIVRKALQLYKYRNTIEANQVYKDMFSQEDSFDSISDFDNPDAVG